MITLMKIKQQQTITDYKTKPGYLIKQNQRNCSTKQAHPAASTVCVCSHSCRSAVLQKRKRRSISKMYTL